MRLRFRCGCGLFNNGFFGWTAHFRNDGFWDGLALLLTTQIILERS